MTGNRNDIVSEHPNTLHHSVAGRFVARQLWYMKQGAVRAAANQPGYPPAYLPACLPTCLPVHMPDCLSTCLPNRLAGRPPCCQA